MDASAVALITTLISNVGFPIVCCGALFWFMAKQSKTHQEETEALRESLNNNTYVLTRLYERLSGGDN